MYKFLANKNTGKGMTQLLLAKRNKQLSAIFKKVRDPITVIQFYQKIHKVYVKYFEDERKADEILTVLTFIDARTHFFFSDLQEKMGFTPIQSDSILKRMGKRHMLIMQKSGNVRIYSMSVDGKLFLRNFIKDCITEMMKVVNNGRTGNKKIYITKKIKKNASTKKAS